MFLMPNVSCKEGGGVAVHRDPMGAPALSSARCMTLETIAPLGNNAEIMLPAVPE